MTRQNEQEEFIKYPANRQSIAMRRLIHGVGVNDSDYVTSYTSKVTGKRVTCPYYTRWLGMINRGYNNKIKMKNISYLHVTVDARWHSFISFKLWMEKQDWEGKHLDKDLLVQGNKVYGPDTCVFISPAINSLVVSARALGNPYAQGVCWDSTRGKFRAQCGEGKKGKDKHLGFFDSEEEASNEYRLYKRQHIISTADKEEGIIKEALYRYADTYTEVL